MRGESHAPLFPETKESWLFILFFWHVDLIYLESVRGLRLTRVFSLQNIYHCISGSKFQHALPSQLATHNVRIRKENLVSVESSGSQTLACIRITWRTHYKHVCLDPTLRLSDSVGVRWGSRTCISIKFSSAVIAVGPGSTLQEPLPQSSGSQPLWCWGPNCVRKQKPGPHPQRFGVRWSGVRDQAWLFKNKKQTFLVIVICRQG